ncbi:MAG: 50S ribosomal protein L37e [Nanoarchaeota archaeon]|nr:50S ribosomal protein L37e [Nanoarchaeota archaeon]
MGKGTAAMGKKSGKKNMIRCRRCGQHAYHIRKKKCSSCGFGNSSKLRKFHGQKN